MELKQNTIYWVAKGPEPLFEGQVVRAVFECRDNKFDVVRAEITCEDATSLYVFEFARDSEEHLVGTCAVFDLKSHNLLSRQATSCALINVITGAASLLAGVPMKAHGRSDLYWLIRTSNVVRNLK